MNKILLMSLLGLSGCVSPVQTIEARNKSSSTVSAFTLKDPRGNKFNFGGLSPNVPAGYGGRMSVKSKDIYQVTWIDSLGRPHQVDVNIHKEIPNGVRGDVIFYLNEDGTVSARLRQTETHH
jgi:hypothetical protein